MVTLRSSTDHFFKMIIITPWIALIRKMIIKEASQHKRAPFCKISEKNVNNTITQSDNSEQILKWSY